MIVMYCFPKAPLQFYLTCVCVTKTWFLSHCSVVHPACSAYTINTWIPSFIIYLNHMFLLHHVFNLKRVLIKNNVLLKKTTTVVLVKTRLVHVVLSSIILSYTHINWTL